MTSGYPGGVSFLMFNTAGGKPKVKYHGGGCRKLRLRIGYQISLPQRDKFWDTYHKGMISS